MNTHGPRYTVHIVHLTVTLRVTGCDRGADVVGVGVAVIMVETEDLYLFRGEKVVDH